jgi:hypothetical protein
MVLINNIEEPIGYTVNVTITGIPYYILPAKVDERKLIMAKNYWKHTGLYYLFDHGTLVYIGVSTRNVYERIISHLKDKIFDSYFVFSAENEDLVCNKEVLIKCTECESILIKKFSPKYNSQSNCALINICQ